MILAVLASAAFGQNTVKSIDKYVKSIDSMATKRKKPDVVYADTSQDGRPQWKKFASPAALEKFRETSETYTVAYVWRKNGKLVDANFTFFSESGDWAQYDNYYFRPNGTLAKTGSELRTFYGNLIVLRDFYFDGRGKLIRKVTSYRDLNTNKPTKKPEEGFDSSEVRIYKSVKKLPFWKL